MKTIEVNNLTKHFGSVKAIEGLSFEVEQGECFGLIGPNEAGKTTTLMLLATVLNPTSGGAKICGQSILKEKDEVRTHIGMVFEEMSLDVQLTGRDNLYFHACMYHMPGKLREQRIKEVLSVVDLEDKADIPVKNYSGGMQRRLEIARSMLTHPKVLLLDEPTVGLDVQTRRFMWDYVRRLNREQGMTVLLATHYIEEADYLCDRVGIINEGNIVTRGKPGELKDVIGKSVVSLAISGESSTGFGQMLVGLPWVDGIQEKNGTLELALRRENVNLSEIARLAQARGLSISSVKIRKPSLEDVFFRSVGISVREK